MGNVIDYLKWRGDLTFEVSPFNQVDSLILSELSYMNFEGIVPGPEVKRNGTITLKKAAELYFKHHTKKDLEADKSFLRGIPELFGEMAKTRRFEGAVLSDYVNCIDVDKQKQFSALHILLEDKTVYISFRGTDDTIAGWREDFNMSFKTVPSQVQAAEYLEETTRRKFRSIRLGGHSKGGNLAVYAAARCPFNVRRKLVAIYCNDAPGFTWDMEQTEGFSQIRPLIFRVVPESSVIGTLFSNDLKEHVVKSSAKGLMQHDGLTWQVVGTDFVYAKERTKVSQEFEKTMQNLLEKMSKEKKEKFIGSFFGAIESTGATTVQELNSGGTKNVVAILKSFTTLDREDKDILRKLLRAFIRCV